MDQKMPPTPVTTPLNSPTWWTESHSSAWDRVKDAFRRDWEQTKADFSSASGQNLNQGIGDTLRQAAGSTPIPRVGEKTHPSAPAAAEKEAHEAHKHLVDAAKKADASIASAQKSLVEDGVKLDAKVAAVREKMASDQLAGSEKVAHAVKASVIEREAQRVKVAEATDERDEVAVKWRKAEPEARYGFAQRLHRPTAVWDEALEGSLRSEWATMGAAGTWEDSRSGVRRGWDYASRGQ